MRQPRQQILTGLVLREVLAEVPLSATLQKNTSQPGPRCSAVAAEQCVRALPVTPTFAVL